MPNYAMRMNGLEPIRSFLQQILSLLRLPLTPHPLSWANWIRTSEYRSQSPVPYHLAIAQWKLFYQLPYFVALCLCP